MLALMYGLGAAGLYLRSTMDPAPDAQFSNQQFFELTRPVSR
jgi:hypothetical protein